MIRDYDNSVSNDVVKYFIGNEVENTSCKGQRTLFVADSEFDINDVIDKALQHECYHIYLGANMIYRNENIDYKLINSCVDECYLENINVTIDIPYCLWDTIIEKLNNKSNLHLNISVELPLISRFNIPNINVKVDDIGFNVLNPGIWVMNLGNRSNYTSWREYKKDKIL